MTDSTYIAKIEYLQYSPNVPYRIFFSKVYEEYSDIGGRSHMFMGYTLRLGDKNIPLMTLLYYLFLPFNKKLSLYYYLKSLKGKIMVFSNDSQSTLLYIGKIIDAKMMDDNMHIYIANAYKCFWRNINEDLADYTWGFRHSVYHMIMQPTTSFRKVSKEEMRRYVRHNRTLAIITQNQHVKINNAKRCRVVLDQLFFGLRTNN